MMKNSATSLRCLFAMLMIAGAGLSHASENTCSASLSALTKSDLEESMRPLHGELSQLHQEAEAVIRREAENCGGLERAECSQAAIQTALSTARTHRLSKFFDDGREMSCIFSKHRSAKDSFVANSNMALNLTASIGTMIAFHDDSKPFNYAMMASLVTFTVYRSIIQCKNELDAPVSGVHLTARQQFKQKFIRYTQLNLVGNGLYVGMFAGQDALQGKNPFEKDNLEKYFHDFVLSMAWDTGFGVLNIQLMDKLFLKSMPNAREQIAQKIREGVMRPVLARVGGKPTLLLKVSNLSQVPGFMLDAFVRAAWTVDRTAAFLEYRESYLGWAIDDTPTAQ